MTGALKPTELLAAEPAVLTNIRIGYARVSTGGQKLERQLDALTAAGCRRIFAEKQSGRDTDRPELVACLDFMHPGDTLVVPSLDRLSRSLQDLIATVGDLRGRPRVAGGQCQDRHQDDAERHQHIGKGDQQDGSDPPVLVIEAKHVSFSDRYGLPVRRPTSYGR
ncbi:recombinase family protein [Micromonospora sp. NPDC047465]|uniref:recombinase family protein n=1 Tax=Micromonospora sp. NPDC047465 TaxID=3154813 RepID=UPI0033E97D89